jgi:hypothetical protein
MGIARQQWRVVIDRPGNELPKERTVFGTREDAEITPRSMIITWLRKAMHTVCIRRRPTAAFMLRKNVLLV